MDVCLGDFEHGLSNIPSYQALKILRLQEQYSTGVWVTLGFAFSPVTFLCFENTVVVACDWPSFIYLEGAFTRLLIDVLTTPCP